MHVTEARILIGSAVVSVVVSLLVVVHEQPALLKKTYLAACRAREFDKARTYFQRIGQEALAQICLRDGFDPR